MSTYTTLVDNEILQIANDMNEELDIYIPADEHSTKMLALYDELFSDFRKLYFLYTDITLEEVKKIFLEFYNSDYTSRSGILNTLENRIQKLISDLIGVVEQYPEFVQAKASELYVQTDNRDTKASLLFFYATGEIPTSQTDLTDFYNEVDAIEIQVSTQLDGQVEVELSPVALQSSVPGVEVEPVELDQSPEAVVSRYLKGSGVYDPALRNSGFRVDKDMQI